MYEEVEVLTQLIFTEVEWNCHLNVRCADICFQNIQCCHNKKGTTGIRDSAF